MIQPFIVATAGHVDHGKSALVRALTGTDPDRLPEEKARGITIDLGFAHGEFPAPPGNRHGATRYSCGIIDVPGHEDFVKNMVAGVGAIDLALLVVAADDGWMPQTEEHLQILAHLGVHRGVIVLSKIDRAVDRNRRRDEIRHRVEGTVFEHAPVVDVSTVTGEGLKALSAAIAATLAQTPAPVDIHQPRLFVDRAFVLRGIGTVVTGTLAGGAITQGESLVVHPGGAPCRVRTCQVHGKEVDRIPCGTRAALNLPELEPRRDSESGGTVGRGDVLTRPAWGSTSDTLDVVVSRFTRSIRPEGPGHRPLTNGARVNLLIGAAQIPARLQLLQSEELEPSGTAIAQLRLSRPVFALAQDRFILRDPAEQTTLAGGFILDPTAPRSGAREPRRLSLLAACAAPTSKTGDFLKLELHRHPIGRIESYLRRAKVSSATALKAVGELIASGETVQRGGLLASASSWSRWLEAAQRSVDDHHLQHPEQLGLALSQLRGWLTQSMAMPMGHDELFHDLERQGFAIDGIRIRRATHRPVLPPELTAAGNQLRRTLAGRALDPPPRSALITGAGGTALRFLVEAGEFIDLGSDVVLTVEAFVEARRKTGDFLSRRGSATTSEIRQHLGTTRRVMIPLLERFDRDGFTLRDGDLRRLRPASPTAPDAVSTAEKPFARGGFPRENP
ncbi:MAG: selenocysteine-specific translation elongation factor [Verrucomicrobiales bacterium]|nr:selenocysteine-specific translation elongation factor [Verrucomicrobiales bacterium]